MAIKTIEFHFEIKYYSVLTPPSPPSPLLLLQDLQAEIESHQHVFESLQTTGRQMVRSSAPTEPEPPPPAALSDSTSLQRRLEEMNQRWVRLKTKSMEIR